MAGLFYFDKASKRRFFFSTWLGYNLLGNFCISKKYTSFLLIKCISVKHANDTDAKSLWQRA